MGFNPYFRELLPSSRVESRTFQIADCRCEISPSVLCLLFLLNPQSEIYPMLYAFFNLHCDHADDRGPASVDVHG
jgi:hypothetical protein